MNDDSEIVWVEDFLDDKMVLEVDGVELGHIEPVGDQKSHWGVHLAGQSSVLAVRPDKQSAQTALMRIVRASEL